MTIAVTLPILGTFDPNVADSSGGYSLLSAVNNNDPEAAALFSPRPRTFSIDGTGLGNEALAIATNLLINLTTAGVLVPVGTMRNIRTRCWSKRAAATNAGYSEMLYCVQGGAPPTVQTPVTLSTTPSFYSDIIPSNDLHQQAGISNINSAGAPTYGRAELYIESGSLCIGFANRAAADGALTTTSGARFKVEILVDALVVLPVFV